MATPAPPCPYCQSPKTQLIDTEGLDASLTRFRCGTCQKEWAEQVQSQSVSKQTEHHTRRPSFDDVS